MYGSLTKIGEAAFFGCSNLKYVNIPEGTTSIGDGAFGCCHFEEISFPNSATHIGSGVLRASIYYLKSLSLPEREKHRLNDILGLDNEGYEDKYVSKIEIKYIPQNQNTNNEVEVSAETKTDNSPVSPENSSNTEPQLSKFQQLLNRAESNDPEAMFEVGRAYENGEDVEKDEQKSIVLKQTTHQEALNTSKKRIISETLMLRSTLEIAMKMEKAQIKISMLRSTVIILPSIKDTIPARIVLAFCIWTQETKKMKSYILQKPQK